MRVSKVVTHHLATTTLLWHWCNTPFKFGRANEIHCKSRCACSKQYHLLWDFLNYISKVFFLSKLLKYLNDFIFDELNIFHKTRKGCSRVWKAWLTLISLSIICPYPVVRFHFVPTRLAFISTCVLILVILMPLSLPKRAPGGRARRLSLIHIDRSSLLR